MIGDTAVLAKAIERDLLAERQGRHDPAKCFACGRPYLPKPQTRDDSNRFCSTRCRGHFDAGAPPYDPTSANKTNPRLYSLPMGATGFLINCAGCARRFDSKGLRYCSHACERRYRGKVENEALMAEAGIERPTKRKCEREGCGRDVPNWRNGRRVSKATRFCGPECAQKARRLQSASNPDLKLETAKRSPFYAGLWGMEK
jgi:hypothetical protein